MTGAWLLFLIVDALVLLVGVYLVYGVVTGQKELVEPPTKWGRFPLFPYWYLDKLFGKNFAGAYHLLVGILFIIMALFGLTFFLFQQ